MIVRRVSRISGKVHELDLPVTPEQMAAFERGVMVQHAFPLLSAEHREFILTGVTPEEWDAAFPPEEDDR